MGTAGGGSDNYRVVATVENQSGVTSVGLQSALWYYDRPVSDILRSGWMPRPGNILFDNIHNLIYISD